MSWSPPPPAFVNPKLWKDVGKYRTTPLAPFPLPIDLFWIRIKKRKAELAKKALEEKN